MNFFGLQTSDRYHIFNQIHEIVFHGKGGYDWWTVYNLPISHRKFIYKQISEFYKKERDAVNGEDLIDNKIKPPDIFKKIPKAPNPDKKSTYSTKLTKK